MELLFSALFIKHFIVDFPLQNKFQYLNKGKFLHLGGILHASLHGIGTLLVCLMFDLPLWLSLLDAVIHYHIDYFKVRINNYYKLGPTTSEKFWWLLGLDQLLHYLTYAFIASYYVA